MIDVMQHLLEPMIQTHSFVMTYGTPHDIGIDTMSVKDLWSSVVLQAMLDIETEHYGSVAYAQAVSFFTAGGYWAESRGNLADCLDLHPDDLMRGGRAAIAARHLRDGPPPVSQRRSVALPVQPQRPEPAPPPMAPVVTKPALPKVKPKPKVRPKVKCPTNLHDREWWIARFLAKQRAA